MIELVLFIVFAACVLFRFALTFKVSGLAVAGLLFVVLLYALAGNKHLTEKSANNTERYLNQIGKDKAYYVK